VLFDTNISAAVRCTHCGRLAIREISLFNLSRGIMHEEVCECGERLFRIKSSDSKTFCVYINCIACDKEHLYIFNSRQVLSEKLKILSCPNSRLDIAFVGNRKLVKQVAAKYQKDLQELIKVLEG
jgi:iron only hydrogenase large subunit-like protein